MKEEYNINKSCNKFFTIRNKSAKNLLSVFLANDNVLSYQQLKEMLPEDIIQDETLIIVKIQLTN